MVSRTRVCLFPVRTVFSDKGYSRKNVARTLKIFISSPGDVIPERELARKVIGELNEEMMGKVFLVPVLWEKEPLLASGTFQTQIDSPEETEILLGILWSRIGSPLPDSILRPDGSRYDSGTAFEFGSALASHQKKGKPDILLYRKLGAPSVSLDNRKELMEGLEQMDRLDSYIKKQLMAEDGSYLAAFHTFETEEKFEEILKTHLRKLILKQLEKPEEVDSGTEVPAAVPQLPDTLSVAVLPFDNMSKDPEQEFFVDGLTEDIITELSRFKDLDVIARNSTFQYRGKSVDVREVAQELGVHYVLEGSVRKAGNALRITGQLLDATDGSHLWAETYDRNLSETTIFDVQDELSQGIASVIGDLWGVLGQIRQGRVVRENQDDLDSDESVAYGNAYFRTGSKDEHFQARKIIEIALERDPDNGDHSFLGLVGNAGIRT
jgi:TolB-like protein